MSEVQAQKSKKGKKGKKSKFNKDAKSAAPKKVEKQERKKRAKIQPPSRPVPFMGDIMNPLLDNHRNKRALTIAFARCTDDDNLLIRCIRESGILFKAGMTPENTTTNTLSQSELGAKGYAIRFGRKMQDEYYTQYPDKVENCMEFAKAFLKAIQKSNWDDVKNTVITENDKAHQSKSA
jgi:hypothetical protein